MRGSLHLLLPAARAVESDMDLVLLRADASDTWAVRPHDAPADALEFETRFEIMSAIVDLLEGGASATEAVDNLVRDHTDIRPEVEHLVQKVERLVAVTATDRECRSCPYCFGPLAVRDWILSEEDLLQGNVGLSGEWSYKAGEVRLRCLRCWAEHSGAETLFDEAE
jgi:hypothetical protein